MTLMNYTDFLIETYYDVDVKNAKLRFLKAAAKDAMAIDENEMFLILLEENQGLILEALDTNNYESINESLITESFLSKAKERYEKLKDAVKDKGKEAINKMSDASKNLLKVGGDILKPIKKIIEKMGDMISAAWDKVKSATESAVEKALPVLKEKLRNLVKDGDKAKSLSQEAGNVKAMTGAGLKLIKGGFTKMIAGAGAKAAESSEGTTYLSMLEYGMISAAAELIEEGYGVENMLNEAMELDILLEGHGHDEGGLHIPFVSAIMTKIGHMPPFSLFHKIEASVAEIANNGLERASALIARLDGPGPFKFHIIGGLVGVAAGYLAEQYAKGKVFSEKGAKILGYAIPGASVLYSIIKYTGYALAIYGVVKEFAGQGEKEKGEDDGHGDDKGHDNKDEKKDKH